MIDLDWVSRLTDFRPAWWLPGGHAQTLSAAFWKGPQPPEQGIARPIALPDGDALVAIDNCPASWKPGDPAIVMMHGLGGCARNPFLVRVTEKLTKRGVRVFRLNLRSCGAGAGLARLPYNAGRSGDLKAAVNAVIEWCRAPRGRGFEPAESEFNCNQTFAPSTACSPLPPGEGLGVRAVQQDNTRSRSHREESEGQPSGTLSHAETPLTLFGMSLSGNLLLKYLGEEGEHVPSSVPRAVAINPPIDLARSVKTLDRPLNRMYDSHFVQALITHVRRQQMLRSDFALLPEPLPSTLFDFDHRFTAPHGGYSNAAAYYAAASSQSGISRIEVPTLILTAADDPLVPVEMFREQRPHWPESVHLAITCGGGHLGYVSRSNADPDSRWLDWRVVEFVLGM